MARRNVPKNSTSSLILSKRPKLDPVWPSQGPRTPNMAQRRPYMSPTWAVPSPISSREKLYIYYFYINIMYTSTTIHAHVYLQTYTCTQHTPDISTWRLMEIPGSDACSKSGHGRFDGRSGAAGNRIRRSWALDPVEGWTIGVLG